MFETREVNKTFMSMIRKYHNHTLQTNPWRDRRLEHTILYTQKNILKLN